tara:strand:- start:17351 stop:17725 length:375 start_codon:yes stop_codon:yes gene_type:complete
MRAARVFGDVLKPLIGQLLSGASLTVNINSTKHVDERTLVASAVAICVALSCVVVTFALIVVAGCFVYTSRDSRGMALPPISAQRLMLTGKSTQRPNLNVDLRAMVGGIDCDGSEEDFVLIKSG